MKAAISLNRKPNRLHRLLVLCSFTSGCSLLFSFGRRLFVVLFQAQVAVVCQALRFWLHRQTPLNEQIKVVQLARAERLG